MTKKKKNYRLLGHLKLGKKCKLFQLTVAYLRQILESQFELFVTKKKIFFFILPF